MSEHIVTMRFGSNNTEIRVYAYNRGMARDIAKEQYPNGRVLGVEKA